MPGEYALRVGLLCTPVTWWNKVRCNVWPILLMIYGQFYINLQGFVCTCNLLVQSDMTHLFDSTLGFVICVDNFNLMVQKEATGMCDQ